MVRHASLFSQLVALLFCQLAQAKSLGQICGGLSCCLGKLRHLGVKKAPNKSTLSYANAHRPWQMYQKLFYQTLDICRMSGKGSLADRTFLQGLETESESQNLCEHQRECPVYPDLDSINRHVADQISSVQIQDQLVTIELGGLLTMEPFYLQGFMGLDR